ncbi:MAG: PadR family transcriptional regulator, regulatory protein PadR [bacterium]|nr:MAG: Transcriptional regulator, PadR-like family [bacterium 42_11]MDK2871501.1 PadR family transcriptional regulator, regulatory protein PadR [bacterium]
MGGDLLIPAILAILSKKPAHGYSLIEELSGLGIEPSLFHHSSIYRALRALEVEGLLISDWDVGEGGPPKRVYRITERGKAFLKRWASSARENLKVIERVIKLIEGGE